MADDSKTIRVKTDTYCKLRALKEELFDTRTASFDAVVDELIELNEDDE